MYLKLFTPFLSSIYLSAVAVFNTHVAVVTDLFKGALSRISSLNLGTERMNQRESQTENAGGKKEKKRENSKKDLRDEKQRDLELNEMKPLAVSYFSTISGCCNILNISAGLAN